ncbi:copper resistance protein NlpE [Proteiniphilum sp.]|uniref:copper resistance protein NlpE n=1 Tax=Proteiniphilum sp. TaxID=1926877 RepID=UPI002B2124CB|nr:copper resistance protein NlpE [Proteiniphilum sp.]MEA4918666.1 copper resistance protein NlpE [Proteiniphilum sp.]
MKKNVILICFALVALSACNTGTNRSNNARVNGTEVADPAHNSRNSLDWAGVYTGTLPCADCEGIDVEIRLNEDLTYERVMIYRGKGDNRLSDSGRFEWDENGSKIKLIDSTSPGSANNWFQVGENKLFVLDTEGNRIESSLPPETYIFEKTEVFE